MNFAKATLKYNAILGTVLSLEFQKILSTSLILETFEEK